MKLRRARVHEIALKMKGMPAAPATEACVTKQEAVRMLAGEIASLQHRGYTLEMITDGLRGDGLELTTPTLKSYLSRAKAGRRPRRAAPGDKRLPAVPTPASTREQTAASTKNEAPAKSGKDAFLVKDKDSY
jgi:hypothetical protein